MIAAAAGRGNNQGAGLQPVNLFQLRGGHLARFRFEIAGLSRHHAVRRSPLRGDFRD